MKKTRATITSMTDDSNSLNDDDPPPPKKKKQKDDGSVDEEPETLPAAKNTAWLLDLPDEILLRNIIPFVGDYQYRFVGLVNHAFHDAYVAVYPKKRTYYTILTKEHLKICYEENHCMASLPILFPLLAKKGDLEMTLHRSGSTCQ
jgi:hypothetical protein